MNADARLFQFCEEWHALTKAERDAIRIADWDRLATLQEQKHSVQARIVGMQERSSPPAPTLTFEERHPAIGQQLLLLERANAAALAEISRLVESHRRELEQSSRNLQLLHRAFAQGRQPVWQTYT